MKYTDEYCTKCLIGSWHHIYPDKPEQKHTETFYKDATYKDVIFAPSRFGTAIISLFDMKEFYGTWSVIDGKLHIRDNVKPNYKNPLNLSAFSILKFLYILGDSEYKIELINDDTVILDHCYSIGNEPYKSRMVKI